MSAEFDPYHRWLGIRPDERPVDHYRLLALAPLEDDPDVIAGAADQRMAHVRRFQSGPHSDASQQILNKLAAARVVLLHPEKKTEYDRALRARQADASVGSRPTTGPSRALTYATIAGGLAVIAALAWAVSSSETQVDAPRDGGPVADTGEVAGPPSLPPSPSEESTKAATDVRMDVDATSVDKAEEEPPVSPVAVKPVAPPPESGSPENGPPANGPPPTPAEPVPPAEPGPPPTDDTDAPPAGPRSVPDKTKRARAAEALCARYAAEFAALASDADRAAFAKRLLEAEPAGEDSAAMYARLEAIETLAVEAGDAALVEKTVDRLAASYEIDAAARRAEALVRASELPRPVEAREALTRAIVEQLARATAARRFDVSERLAETALASARKCRDRQLVRSVASAARSARTAAARHASFVEATTALAADPDDGPAHLAAGRFLCLVERDWDAGLPHLAKGSDSRLAALARRDMVGALSTPEQIELGDAWWDRGKASDADDRAALVERTAYWYRLALAASEGAARTRIEKRLATIDPSDAATGPAVAPPSATESWTGPVKATFRPRVALDAERGGVPCLAFSPDGKWLASASTATILFWNVERAKMERSLDGHDDVVRDLAFAPDGRWIASVSQDRTLRLWDSETGKHAASQPATDGPLRCVAFAPDGRGVAVGSTRRGIYTWSVPALEAGSNLAAHEGPVNTIAFSRDGRWLVSAGQDKQVHVWDFAARRIAARLDGHQQGINTVALSPDSRLAASGSRDRRILLWEVPGGRPVRELEPRPHAVRAVAFHPGGRVLASADDGGIVRLWEVPSGRALATLGEHKGAVPALAFAPAGGLLASAGADRTIRLWDVEVTRDRRRK